MTKRIELDGVVGTPAEVMAFQHQLEEVHRRKDLIVVGSVARTAMYRDLNWPKRPGPLELVRGGFLSKAQGDAYRDIDVVSRRPHLPADVFAPNPFRVDGTASVTYWQAGNPPYLLGRGMRSFHLDAKLLEVRERRLAGRPLRTLLVGPMQAFMNRFGADRLTPKMKQATQEFNVFAEWARKQGRARREFPDERHYEAFRRYREAQEA